MCVSGYRMQLLLSLSLCAGLLTGPPLLLSFEVPRDLRLAQLSQIPPPSAPCHYDKMAAIPRGTEPPCKSPVHLDRSLKATTVAQLQVHGPAVHCESGGVCSVSMGSRVQVEVSLPSAPPYLGLSLSLCALSPSSDPFNSSQLPLLVGGCPVSVGVSLSLVPHPPCSMPMKNFSFHLGPYYNNSIQFLHCRVDLCMQDPQLCRGMKSLGSMNIPKCPILDDPCKSFSHPSPEQKTLYLRTVTQPLIVNIPAPSIPFLKFSAAHKTAHKSPLPPLSTCTEERVQGIGVAAVVGVTLCSFFIGILLMAGLWFIHRKTVPVSPVTSGGTQGLQATHS
ncbi:transforming growth factor-beta receptor type 3-like protein [Rhinophrynus dorsalis]